MIVAVVGSGGKTTYIRQQATKYLARGKRVLVTTTTHMYAEKDTKMKTNYTFANTVEKEFVRIVKDTLKDMNIPYAQIALMNFI